MKINLRFKSFEPIITTIKIEKRCTTIKEIGLFNPIRRIIHKLNLWKEKREFKKKGLKPEICDSCGENIAKLVIDNPNYGKRDTWFVCNECADFCDYKMTRRPLLYENK